MDNTKVEKLSIKVLALKYNWKKYTAGDKKKLSTVKTHRSIKGIYFDQLHLILVNLLYKSLFETE